MSKTCYGSSPAPLSPAVRAGDWVYVSGQVPVIDGKVVGTTIEEQTDVCLRNMAEALRLAGCMLKDVVKCSIILPDIADFPGFNSRYAQIFPRNPPARTTIGGALAGPFKVEIECTAFKPVTHPKM